MKYVSAEYLPLSPGQTQPMIKAISDDGLEYFIPDENSDVPPWPEYLADGGTIAPAGAEPSPAANIINAPDDLTGGPTLEEVYNGN